MLSLQKPEGAPNGSDSAHYDSVRSNAGDPGIWPRDFCHNSAGELEQIQFPLGHVSAQTTEKYLGSEQRLREAVNDRIEIEPS